MKITLYMATSIDGLIATSDGNSEWVSPTDVPVFTKKITDAGCVIMGGKTFEQYKGEMFPVEKVLNVVVTNRLAENYENVMFVPTTVETLIPELEKRGIAEAILIGGGRTNKLFLEANLVDEMFVVVHPLLLGQGIHLFEGIEMNKNLELIDCKQREEGLVQLQYRFNKSS